MASRILLTFTIAITMLEWNQYGIGVAADPSPNPTLEPSQSSDPFCDVLYVDISDFDDITANTLNTKITLQSIMVNITHEAIANSASSLSDFFHVLFQNATDSLLIKFSLCVSEQQTLDILNLVVEEYANDISDDLKTGLMDKFGIRNDSMTVTVSLTEFCCFFEDFQFL